MARARVILLLLLLGAVTSVAVAWLTAVWYVSNELRSSKGPHMDRGAGVVTLRWLSSGIGSEPGPPRIGGPQVDPTEFPRWSLARQENGHERAPCFELATGWPLLCLRCVVEGDGYFNQPLGMTSTGALEGWLPMSRLKAGRLDVTRLPARPMWFRLAVNSIVWLLVLCAPRLRVIPMGHWRRHRSRCPRCGYDLSHVPSTVCPECGQGVASLPRLTGMPPAWPILMVLVLLVVLEAAFVVLFTNRPAALPIHQASWSGDVEIVRRELAAGISANAPMPPVEYPMYLRYQATSTPLLLAVMRSHGEVVRALIEAGADVNATHIAVNRRVPVLHYAITRGDAAMTGQLLAAGADPAQLGYRSEPAEPALMMAMDLPAPDVFDVVLEYLRAKGGVEIPWDGLLWKAIAAGDTIWIEALLDRGAVPGHQCLTYAMNIADKELFEKLVLLGADLTVEVRGETLLFEFPEPRWEAGTDDLEAIDATLAMWTQIVNVGVDVNAAESILGMTALMRAVHSGRPPLVQFLLEHGADVSIEGDKGITALGAASNSGSLEIATMLLELGARPSCLSLQYAVARGDRAMLDLMLAHGGDLRWRDAAGQTLLFMGGALQWGPRHLRFDESIFKRILEAGVDINIMAWRRETALMKAVDIPDSEDLVRFLLDHGADPTIKNNADQTALDLARAEYKPILKQAIDDRLRDNQDTPPD